MGEGGEKMPDVQLGLKAEASAKLDVKAEIPPDTTGRMVDALTDIIRPFSEKRGLKADQIRLQREEVAIEIAKRAKARLAIEQSEPNPVPNKFMVPFLEKASLEEPNSRLIDLWAQLLAKASEKYDSSLQVLSDTLSKISYTDVLVLRAFLKDARSFSGIDIMWGDAYLNGWLERQRLTLKVPIFPQYLANEVFRRFDLAGLRLTAVTVRSERDVLRGEPGYTVYDPNFANDQLALDVLCLYNLIQIDKVPNGKFGEFRISLTGFRITSLGRKLLEICKEEENKDVQ